jgi:hypothetical protein
MTLFGTYESLVVQDGKIVDVYARRDLKKVLSDLTLPDEYVMSLFVFIDYLDDLNMNKRLFHGDVKP